MHWSPLNPREKHEYYEHKTDAAVKWRPVCVTLMSGFMWNEARIDLGDPHRSAAALLALSAPLPFIIEHRDAPSSSGPLFLTDRSDAAAKDPEGARSGSVRLSYIHGLVWSCFWPLSGYIWPTSAEPHRNIGCNAHASLRTHQHDVFNASIRSTIEISFTFINRLDL